jgi:pimeloyl-ACP methyl ester carboxylesterase
MIFQSFNATMLTSSPASVPPPELRHLSANGLSLAYFEWHAERRGSQPSLFLIHATGFHARVWDQVVACFADRHVIALELRGHGRSSFAPFSSWHDFGEDVTAAARSLGLQGAIGVGHSMGAHALVHAAAMLPDSFSRLVLIDPTLFAPQAYLQAPPVSDVPHPVSLRKNYFESPEEMFQRFADKVPYLAFQKEALRDYCFHGLLPTPDGKGFHLACAPTTEGQIYNSARRDRTLYNSIRAIDLPVRVIRARASDPTILPFDTLGSPTWPAVAQEFRRGEDIHLPERTHMLPMEDPQLTADLISQPAR